MQCNLADKDTFIICTNEQKLTNEKESDFYSTLFCSSLSMLKIVSEHTCVKLDREVLRGHDFGAF